MTHSLSTADANLILKVYIYLILQYTVPIPVQDKGAVEGEEAHGHAAVPDAAEAGGGATEAEPGSDDRGVRARDHHVLRHCRLYADLIAQFSVTGTLVSSGSSKFRYIELSGYFSSGSVNCRCLNVFVNANMV